MPPQILLSAFAPNERTIVLIPGAKFGSSKCWPPRYFAQLADRWPDGDATLGFFRVDVDDGGLRETFVPLERVSSAAGAYGPGGHPRPEDRDYSAAAEA